ncbi:DUF1064 domain-containing protein [Nevskia sp.]|uniref:DUF1064 domain-containing protein n=1 Tax=Nevskia sp. TaxID=1929292 RepID=UPI002601291A|nr:DUF1064 domain-containing protein [Nevskia sp.]
MRRALTLKLPPLPGVTPASKYRNEPTVIDGIRFDSKGEAGLYSMLQLLKAGREVSYFLRQVPIALPGSVRYVVDFQVFYRDGRIRYLDYKGAETPMFVLKKKQVEALYPIRIECIRRVRGRFEGL